MKILNKIKFSKIKKTKINSDKNSNLKFIKLNRAFDHIFITLNKTVNYSQINLIKIISLNI